MEWWFNVPEGFAPHISELKKIFHNQEFSLFPFADNAKVREGKFSISYSITMESPGGSVTEVVRGAKFEGTKSRRRHNGRLPRRDRLQTRRALPRGALQIFHFRQGRNFRRNVRIRKPHSARGVVGPRSLHGQEARLRLRARVFPATLARGALFDSVFGRLRPRTKGRAELAELHISGVLESGVPKEHVSDKPYPRLLQVPLRPQPRQIHTDSGGARRKGDGRLRALGAREALPGANPRIQAPRPVRRTGIRFWARRK